MFGAPFVGEGAEEERGVRSGGPGLSLPGRSHDLTAARAHSIVQTCLTHEILALADRACQGQGAGATVRTPHYRHREQHAHSQPYNRGHARLRAPGERAFARLKSCRLLRGARCSPHRISQIIAATHTPSPAETQDERH